MRTGISTTENYLSTCGDGVTGLLGLEMKTEPAMRTGISTTENYLSTYGDGITGSWGL